MTREEQLSQFESVYAQLNQEQKAAVDQIEGPVMVIAGPGTGKTQILSARIGKILLETDVLPQNILCLTYTDAGAVAMRRRLVKFIGPAAYQVNIGTFHAFCNDVIQDNLTLFNKRSMDPISDVEAIQLLQSLIDEWPVDHPLKRLKGEIYYDVPHLRHLFSTMKREGFTAHYIHECIAAYELEMAVNEDYIYKKNTGNNKKGDYKATYFDELERMNKLRAAVDEYPKYQEKLLAANRYDFDDMINWVVQAFQQHPNLLARYQEQYQYILVDEYQDTSGLQNNLVSLLINYWEQPNIFVVGDDDQSIYRFQGANVENMLHFAEAYEKDLFKVVLTNNYRSTQPILDAAKGLIDINQERLIRKIPGLTKTLLAANANKQAHAQLPDFKVYANPKQELIATVLSIESLLQQGIQPGKIGVIYRENKMGDELTKYLQLKQIPVFSKRQLNLLDLPIIEQLVLLLEYIDAELSNPGQGDEMLFRLLHFDWWNIPAIQIARMANAAYQSKRQKQASSFREYLAAGMASAPIDLFTTVIPARMQKAIHALENLITLAAQTTLQQLLEGILRQTGLLEHCLRSSDKHGLLHILTAFFDFVKEETRRKPTMRVRELVKVLHTMRNEKISLPFIQVIGNEEGVNLMTAHGSKGLEFEQVFLIGANEKNWEKKKAGSRSFKLPATVFKHQSDPQEQQEEELRRLFYVALTRAEMHVTVSYSRFDDKGKEWNPSRFVAEAIDQSPELRSRFVSATEIPVISLDAAAMADFQVLLLDEPEAPLISIDEESFLTKALENFQLSATALNSYLKCPIDFYYSKLVRIPSPLNENMAFGSAMHEALEFYFREMQSHQQVFPPKEKLIEYFQQAMDRRRESFTMEGYERLMPYGISNLLAYYDAHHLHWSTHVEIERKFNHVLLGEARLSGALDKIEHLGSHLHVVDYKTGKPENAGTKLVGPNAKDPLGGDYWRQAVFYKILLDLQGRNNGKSLSVVHFDFLEPSKKTGEYERKEVVIKPEDEGIVKAQIAEVWEKIQAKAFTKGCGDPKCDWCNFVKANPGSFLPASIADEDDN